MDDGWLVKNIVYSTPRKPPTNSTLDFDRRLSKKDYQNLKRRDYIVKSKAKRV